MVVPGPRASAWPAARPGRRRTEGDWTTVQVCVRGQMVERKLWSRTLLWYETTRSRPHLLVIVRDPSGHQQDDFFITSDTSMTPAGVAGLYSDRSAIEDANRNLKQYLGVQKPLSLVGDGPERVIALADWLYSAVWHWYLVVHAEDPTWPDRPCYNEQAHALVRRLAALRSDLVGNSGRSRLRPRLTTNRDHPHLRTGERRVINGRSPKVHVREVPRTASLTPAAILGAAPAVTE